jgi:ligand-binding sensor domain-containing protein
MIPVIKVDCQYFSFREYKVSDGLPQSQGFLIYQDRKGYIWICTNNGLTRFDGIEFKNYFRKDGLPSNSVQQLIEDKAGDLWALSPEGFSKYAGDRFIYYPPTPDLRMIRLTTSITPTDKPGEIYIIGRNISDNLSRLILFSNGKYAIYSSKDHSFEESGYKSIFFDTLTSDLLLLDVSNHLMLYKDERLKKVSDRNVGGFLSNQHKTLVWSDDSLFEYRDKNIFPFFSDGTRFKGEMNFRTTDQSGSVSFFDGAESITMKLPFKPTHIFMDDEGTLWFPSENNVYRLLSSSFISLTKDLIGTTDVWTICTNKDGNLWMGTLSGNLLEYNGMNVSQRDEFKKLFPGIIAFYKGSRLLSDGEIWFSLNEGILIRKGSAFSRFEGIPGGTQVCYIYEDTINHNKIIGTNKGLFTVDHSLVKNFPQFNDDSLGIIEGVVRDDSGFYWLSGHKGLVKFDRTNATPVKEETLPSTFTYNIDKDYNGGIWVSTDEGLFCKKRYDKHFFNLLTGSVNKPANALKIINDSLLLVGRAADICLIDLHKFYNNVKDYYRIYDKTDGYLGDDCLDNGIITDRDGSCWILTSDNVVRVDPGSLKKNIVPPRTFLSGLFYETDSLTWQPACKNDFYFNVPPDINISSHYKKIRITYTGISTKNPEKVQYIFKLDGFDSKWSLPSSKREIIYENLRPGKYHFHLKGINADGIQNTVATDLTFTITPTIWESMFFRISLIVIVVCFTFLLTKLIINGRQKRKEEKHKIKSELLKLQMNSMLREFDPHFTFNAISSVGSLIMKNNREEAYTYLARLSAMLRSVLHDGSSILKPLSDEIDFVKHYCELQKLRFGERFSYNISVSEDVDIMKEIPKMTVQTFVENAVKHGLEYRKEGGRVDVILTHKEDAISIVIRDNGIGREASKRLKTGGTGHGLVTIRRIFEIINQENQCKSTLEIGDVMEYGSPAGTIVSILIPDEYSFRQADSLS